MLRLRMAHKLWLAVAAIVVALVGVVGLSGYRSAQVQARSGPSPRRCRRGSRPPCAGWG